MNVTDPSHILGSPTSFASFLNTWLTLEHSNTCGLAHLHAYAHAPSSLEKIQTEYYAFSESPLQTAMVRELLLFGAITRFRETIVQSGGAHSLLYEEDIDALTEFISGHSSLNVNLTNVVMLTVDNDNTPRIQMSLPQTQSLCTPDPSHPTTIVLCHGKSKSVFERIALVTKNNIETRFHLSSAPVGAIEVVLKRYFVLGESVNVMSKIKLLSAIREKAVDGSGKRKSPIKKIRIRQIIDHYLRCVGFVFVPHDKHFHIVAMDDDGPGPILSSSHMTDIVFVNEGLVYLSDLSSGLFVFGTSHPPTYKDIKTSEWSLIATVMPKHGEVPFHQEIDARSPPLLMDIEASALDDMKRMIVVGIRNDIRMLTQMTLFRDQESLPPSGMARARDNMVALAKEAFKKRIMGKDNKPQDYFIQIAEHLLFNESPLSLRMDVKVDIEDAWVFDGDDLEFGIILDSLFPQS
jgi:hypothetical protein